MNFLGNFFVDTLVGSYRIVFLFFGFVLFFGLNGRCGCGVTETQTFGIYNESDVFHNHVYNAADYIGPINF